MKTKWYQSKTVQGAIIVGICTVLAAVITLLKSSPSVQQISKGKSSPNLSNSEQLSPEKNTVLRIRPDDNNIVLPSLTDQNQKYITFPLILWCDKGQTCDLDGIVLQEFDESLNRFVGLALQLADPSGALVSFPLRITDDIKTFVVLRFPVGNEPILKAKVRFVGYDPKDTTVVDVEIQRKPDGYHGMVMSHERHYEFGRGGPQTIEFLKPYREPPDVLLSQH